MKVLIIDAGGRGHAVAWRLLQSPHIDKIYMAPGNGGTALIAENVPLGITHIKRLARFAEKNGIDLTIPCSEAALAAGIVDEFKKRGLAVFGPDKSAARLESSKAFAKNFMKKAGIPTARFRTFTLYQEADRYLEGVRTPIVVKASGLAEGKGVYVCRTKRQAIKALHNIIIDNVHGAKAGRRVVIEEYLQGQELSVLVFCDGKSYAIMPPVRDHKYALDGNKGKMTGGMGAVAGIGLADTALMKDIEGQIVQPTIEKMYAASPGFIGCLFFGLMITADGPKALEYNVRFGDPEIQALMLLLETDLWEILDACIHGKLRHLEIEWSHDYAVCLVLASGGYPGKYETGYPIYGLGKLRDLSDVKVFHAGTGYNADNWLVTTGGRVLNIVAGSKELSGAIKRVYEAANTVQYKDKVCRSDIGRT